jgi:hypothetical protein
MQPKERLCPKCGAPMTFRCETVPDRRYPNYLRMTRVADVPRCPRCDPQPAQPASTANIAR